MASTSEADASGGSDEVPDDFTYLNSPQLDVANRKEGTCFRCPFSLFL
jgi:hypothetical protein